MALAQTPMTTDEDAYVAACADALVARYPTAEPWAPDECAAKWRRTGAAGPMAEAILSLSRVPGDDAPGLQAMKDALGAVEWSGAANGTLGDVEVFLTGDGEVTFHWEEIGAEPRYELADALRVRGIDLVSLGCPVYPGASMGAEKVFRAEAEGAAPLTLAVYSRPAPIGGTPGIFTADLAIGGPAPDRAALLSGNYPGGGGRAFAVDPQGWAEECDDPQ